MISEGYVWFVTLFLFWQIYRLVEAIVSYLDYKEDLYQAQKEAINQRLNREKAKYGDYTED